VRRSWADVWSGTIFILSVFAIVILHELGHALTARRFGIRTRDITLLPIGGVARLERMPSDPWQELLVAIAGPVVNVALAGLLFVIIAFAASGVMIDDLQLVGGNFLVKLFWVNVVLAAFNMLPAFPMDGGRVLRAVLATRMDYLRATQIAAGIGQGMALLFGFIGLFFNPFLVFIALFVWMGAAAEASMVQMRVALGGIPVSRAMITDFRTLAPEDRLRTAVQHIIAGFQQDFPVLDGERLVGVLTRDDLLKTIAQAGDGQPVHEAMKAQFETAEAGEMLETAFTRLQHCACHSLPVLDRGRLVGMLTMENVGEFLMIETAARSAAAVRSTARATA
jgi:Zn-dependent protease/CBS domain-containing protein